MKKLFLGILVLGLLFSVNSEAYSGRKAEIKGKIYIGILKGDFCTNTLNFPCWDAKKKRINKKNKYPNLYYYDGSKYEILTTDDLRFYLFKGVTSPAWKREKIRIDWGGKFNSNYGDGLLISMHDSMADAKEYMRKEIAGLNKKEEAEKPKTVAKKPEKSKRANTKLDNVFKKGITKEEMCKLTRNKNAISGTVLEGAAYCHKGFQSQYIYFQEYKTEIITPPNLPGRNYFAPVHFVFENVTIPMKCSFNTICNHGDGRLKSIAYSREEALAFADPIYAKTDE